ncbi:MAG: DUF2937 family protein [Bacteroidota bacterium]
MGLFNFLGNLSERIFTVILAVIFAQAPVYMNQYTHVLAGAQKESETTYLDLENRAAGYDQTVEAFLNDLMQNEDPRVKDNAEVSWNTVKRYLDYDKALKSLRNSNAFTRPFNFLRHLDGRIRSAVKFSPSLPLNFEGLIYAILGVLVAMGISGLFGKWTGKKKKESVNQA